MNGIRKRAARYAATRLWDSMTDDGIWEIVNGSSRTTRFWHHALRIIMWKA